MKERKDGQRWGWNRNKHKNDKEVTVKPENEELAKKQLKHGYRQD